MTRHTGIIGAALLLLTAQAALTHRLSRTEFIPSPGPIAENIPATIGDWSRFQDGVLDPEVYEMLAPDDVLNRTYRDPAASSELNLFIGYYKTQLRAKNAHDPKVCLPGAGWNPLISKQIPITVAGVAEPVNVNYYVISKNGEQAVVLYWFQNYKTAYTTEQGLKYSRVLDNILENRTDMALVRIVISATKPGIEPATAKAIDFARLLYPSLEKQFPRI
jgi:EpsI family protein